MSNPYESGVQKNIPAVLVYLEHGSRVLMLHRNAKGRPGDFHAGKWNGVGGKCESGESYLATAVRETEEETGIQVRADQLRFAGFLQFPHFKPAKNEDWSVMVFSAQISDEQSQMLREVGAEGSLHWIERAEVLKLNLWPGDVHFLPRVLRHENFYGAIWYAADGSVMRVEIQAANSD